MTTLYEMKSTGQQVHSVPSLVKGGNPWDHGYKRVYRAFTGLEGSRSGKKGETFIIHESNLEAV